jgi:hypothetical protein
MLSRLVCTTAMTTWALLAPAPAVAVPISVPGPTAPPSTRPLSRLLTDFQRLYREAEQATETYDSATEKLKKQQAKVARLDRQLVLARLDLQSSRGEAGRLARQQYRASTDISPYVRLLLARDPQHALDAGHLIGRLTRERAAAVHRLTGAEKRADAVARAARKALDDQLVLTGRRQQARDDVEQRLKAIEDLLASLTAQQIAALAEAEGDMATTAPRQTGDPDLSGPQTPASDAR